MVMLVLPLRWPGRIELAPALHSPKHQGRKKKKATSEPADRIAGMRIGGESPTWELVPIEASQTASGGTLAKAPEATFSKALEGIGAAVDRGEALIARAAHGNLGGLDSGQLIALQAGIYRYSEAVDLVAKVVDRTSNAVKTVVSPH
jgi:hypothetical protein